MIASEKIKILYWDPNFVSSQQVWLVLRNCGLEVQLHSYSIFGLEFLHMQGEGAIPKGLWPPLLHEGNVIYEGSKNCLEYIQSLPEFATLRAPAWLDGRGQKMANLALDLEDHLLLVDGEFFYRPHMKPYRQHVDSFINNIKDKTKSNLMDNIISGELSQQALSISLDTIHAALSTIDIHLEHQMTISGDEYGYADIVWLPVIRRLLFLRWPIETLYREIMPWYEHASKHYPNVQELANYEQFQAQKGFFHTLWHNINWIGGRNLPASLKLRGITTRKED